MIHDAIVVGAGPAGSFCAYRLARAGASVLLLEKAAMPRPKVCGGALSRKVFRLVDFDLSPIVHNGVRRATLTYGNELSVDVDLQEAGACTTVREEFDAWLAERARSAGASVLEGTRFIGAEETADGVSVETSAGIFRCRHLVGADGVGSQVRKRMMGGGSVRQVPSVELLLRVSPSVLDRYRDRALFDLGGMSRGYGWIFPKRDHLNVGIYSPLGARQLPAQLDAFLGLHGDLRGAQPLARLGYAIPLFDRSRPLALGRTILVGDAAGCVEGVYGEGIYYAMRSGDLAARALLEAANGGSDAAARYRAAMEQTLAPELTISNWIGRAYFAFPRFSFRHLAMNPRGQRKFAGIITGDVSYRDCLRSMIRSAPRWLFTAAKA
ncbi:MAG: geranylgeranyl reductase family protein [Betaproteobacteria bacterium]|nr:geranylgeranyl reductase family protein [Betaproteobacteria bacterium]